MSSHYLPMTPTFHLPGCYTGAVWVHFIYSMAVGCTKELRGAFSWTQDLPRL